MGVELTFTEQPPGVNNLYINVPGRGRALTQEAKDWRLVAGLQLNIQRPEHIAGPVRIDLAIADKGECDLDGKAKMVLDLLVGHGVIEQDNRHVVREIHMSWDAQISGCRVRVEAMP